MKLIQGLELALLWNFILDSYSKLVECMCSICIELGDEIILKSDTNNKKGINDNSIKKNLQSKKCVFSIMLARNNINMLASITH